MLQKQIELGRIVLSENLEVTERTAEQEECAAAAATRGAAVGQHLAWLLAAHRGAGQAPPGAAAGDTQAQEEQQQGDADGSDDEEGRAAAEASRLQEQLRDISRSLWGALSGGAPPVGSAGACSSGGAPGGYTSRSKADYQYSQEAVAAMRSTGELDSTHHRRRDAHTAHVEASARDALLRRGGSGKSSTRVARQAGQ